MIVTGNPGLGIPQRYDQTQTEKIGYANANETAKRVSDLAIQVLGGHYGYTAEYSIATPTDGRSPGVRPGSQRMRIVSEYLGWRFEQRPPDAITPGANAQSSNTA
jgi:hypothetical protein